MNIEGVREVDPGNNGFSEARSIAYTYVFVFISRGVSILSTASMTMTMPRQ